MACYHPVTMWKIPKGNGEYEHTHNPIKGTKGVNAGIEYQRPCGQCIGCKLAKSREWSVRCMHEASLHWDNCWLTLTLNEEYKNTRSNPLSLERGKGSEMERFFKRLRKKFGEGIRYYYCGEYGETCFFCNKTEKMCYTKGCGHFFPWRGRPHYHVCLFNADFDDKILYKYINGLPHYTSETLDGLWTDPVTNLFMGTATISDLTEDSAAYTARYTIKKINGQLARQVNPVTDLLHYQRINNYGEIIDLLPEYTNMSRGSKKLGTGGIGKGWLDKYSKEVIDNDSVFFKETRIKPPRYYDNIMSQTVPQIIEDNKQKRIDKAISSPDNTPDRLVVREAIAKQKSKSLYRKEI
jgi:hypothetical protein